MKILAFSSDFWSNTRQTSACFSLNQKIGTLEPKGGKVANDEFGYYPNGKHDADKHYNKNQFQEEDVVKGDEGEKVGDGGSKIFLNDVDGEDEGPSREEDSK